MGQIKIGTDICSVKRIKTAYEKYGQRFLNRILTGNEKSYIKCIVCTSDTLKLSLLSQRLAGRFAAKEALAKALGTGWNGISWKEVEIINAESGEPKIFLSGRAKKLLSQRAFKNIDVSISHEREYAIATVLLY